MKKNKFSSDGNKVAQLKLAKSQIKLIIKI